MNDFTNAYIRCALQTETDSDGDPLGYNRQKDIHPDTLAQMDADCKNFVQTLSQKLHNTLNDMDRYEYFPNGTWSQAGYDFWLTRNGHGAGFWDGDWPDEDIASRLDQIAKGFGEFNLYVGDDGLIHGTKG